MENKNGILETFWRKFVKFITHPLFVLIFTLLVCIFTFVLCAVVGYGVCNVSALDFTSYSECASFFFDMAVLCVLFCSFSISMIWICFDSMYKGYKALKAEKDANSQDVKDG